MSYKPGRKIYELTYVDYPGLEVRMHGTTIGKLEALSKLAANISAATPEQKMSIFQFFVSKLISWNIVHPEVITEASDGPQEGVCANCGMMEDDPLPTTPAGLGCLELEFVTNIIRGWMETIGGASGPKAPNISNGGMNTETQMNRLGNLQSPLI